MKNINKKVHELKSLDTKEYQAIRKAIGLCLFATFALSAPVYTNAQTTKRGDKQEQFNEQYNYEKGLHMDVSELPAETVKKIMLQRLNDIRREYGLKPLVYDNRLERFALAFATEKNKTEWRKDPDMHFDKKGNGLYDRMKIAGIRDIVNPHVVDEDVLGIGENIITTKNSVYDQMEAFMNSPGHRDPILSKYLTKVGFGYKDGYTTLVQVFADLKK